MESLEGSKYARDDERLIEIPVLNHFRADETYSVLSKKIEELFEIIPEIETLDCINEI